MTELAYPSGLSRGWGVVSLQSIMDQLQPREVQRFRHLVVERLVFNSTEAQPGSLFFAIPGNRQNGSIYAQDAVQRGAVAVVAEQALNLPCPVLVVADARKALADAAALYYGHPSKSLPVVGVTGTNGKTTVSYLIRNCVELEDKQVGVIGTNGWDFAGRKVPTTNTTPDPLRIQGYLRDMQDRQAQACVMEVSSHALVQERVRAVDYQVGVFLNLTQDHLDYHGTLDAYTEAKAKLFAGLRAGATACLSADSDASQRMAEKLAPGVKVRYFGLDGEVEVRAENLRCSLEGTQFDLVMPRGRVAMMLRLPGLHNVQNALAAASASLALGVSELSIATALEAARPVDGRLQLVGHKEGVRLYVDYAHTPDALAKVCSALWGLTDGRLIVVFGCGGDRDKGKRPLMAKAVAENADLGIMTSDNPRSEDPEAIIDDMEAGMQPARAEFFRIADRAQAICRAVNTARPGDTVLVAGKGHESYQVLRDSVVPFDDRQVSLEALLAKERKT